MTTGQKHLPYPKRGVPVLRDWNSLWPYDQFKTDVEKWLYQVEFRCLGFYSYWTGEEYKAGMKRVDNIMEKDV